jgi:hypothetical protein
MARKEIRMLILVMFLVSLGGLLLHLRIHPPAAKALNKVPAVAGALSVVAVPLLFGWRRTAVAAYLLNAAAVLVGVVGMGWFSIQQWQGPVTWDAVLLKSMLPDILILLAKLPLAQAILSAYAALPRPLHVA